MQYSTTRGWEIGEGLSTPRFMPFSPHYASVDKNQREFAYDTLVKSGESVVQTQRCCMRHFPFRRHANEILSQNTILRRVNAFRFKGSVMKTKLPYPTCSTRQHAHHKDTKSDRVREGI